jgi:hypothetical protein
MRSCVTAEINIRRGTLPLIIAYYLLCDKNHQLMFQRFLRPMEDFFVTSI